MAVIDNMRVSREAMEQAITTFEARKDSLENTYLKISNEVRNLDGTWDGQASEAFKNRFNDLYKNIENTEKAMATIVSDLKAAVERYEQGEEQAQKVIDAATEGFAYKANF